MAIKLNGNTGLWASRVAIIVGIGTIIGMLMSQSIDKGKMITNIENNGDKNTILEAMIEKRDAKFDTFLLQQTKKNTIDSMQTIELLRFLEKQTELNEVVKEHIIKGFTLNDDRFKSGSSMNYFNNFISK